MPREQRRLEEAQAWGNTQEMRTSSRCAARYRGEYEVTSENTGSPDPDGGLARHAMDKSPWHVFRLQKRMYHAAHRGEVRTVHNLQKLLTKSWYARLLAVRRVTPDKRGQHTAGSDGVNSFTPPQRGRLASQLRLPRTATPLRRPGIPKRGSPEKRPLGIPPPHERAPQTLGRQALEPEWEAPLSAHFYGFRPGRSCWDAIAAVFHRLK